MSSRARFLGFMTMVVSFAGILLVGELFCRLFFPDVQLRYKSDPDALYFFEPNQKGVQILSNGSPSPLATINELGLRGSFPKQEGRKVLVLGDSFTFGAGVADNETFAARLDAAMGREVRVVNGGMPGYGVFQMQATLARVADVVKPELVIVVIWEGDFLRRPLSDEERTRLFRSQAISGVVKTSVLLTHTYRMIERAAILLGKEQVVVHRGEGGSGAANLDSYFRGLEADRARLFLMHDLAKKYGKGLVVVLWTKEGFNVQIPDMEKGFGLRLTDRLRAVSLELGIPFHSLRPAMEAMLPKGRLTIAGDGHPNSLGHCVAAQSILEAIRPLGYTAFAPIICQP